MLQKIYLYILYILDAYGIAVQHSRAPNGVSQGDHLDRCSIFTCVLICLNNNDCGGVNFKSLGGDVCVCELVEPVNHEGPTLNTDTEWMYYPLS